ncbi:unnamed protein product [Brassicogethes aeneus]|uniref:guanylate kinase n=1 Tax=Brassicogethes aeneus TaxID=1431903 RepID=A0A9P0FL82_BRAAE|nr:unnamed protein product [Brassicogethes aeneus]
MSMNGTSTLRPIVLFGPSGSGKSTLIKRIMKDFPNKFGFSISHTTRKPRPGEVNGVHYHFTNPEEFQNNIDNGLFIESAIFGKNMYGTSKKAVKDVIARGQICILDIDCQGVRKVKKTDLNPLYIFIQPPSMEDLKSRLIKRGTETDESLKNRLEAAKQEIEYGSQPGIANLLIVNDALEDAYNKLKKYLEENVLH